MSRTGVSCEQIESKVNDSLTRRTGLRTVRANKSGALAHCWLLAARFYLLGFSTPTSILRGVTTTCDNIRRLRLS